MFIGRFGHVDALVVINHIFHHCWIMSRFCVFSTVYVVILWLLYCMYIIHYIIKVGICKALYGCMDAVRKLYLLT